MGEQRTGQGAPASAERGRRVARSSATAGGLEGWHTAGWLLCRATVHISAHRGNCTRGTRCKRGAHSLFPPIALANCLTSPFVPSPFTAALCEQPVVVPSNPFKGHFAHQHCKHITACEVTASLLPCLCSCPPPQGVHSLPCLCSPPPPFPVRPRSPRPPRCMGPSHPLALP